MGFENLNNEFNKIRGEYISKREYEFIEEKIEEPEEFYNEINVKDKIKTKADTLENNKLSDSSSETSSFKGQALSSNSTAVHGLSAMGTAASAMTICVAAAGISIYSNNFDSSIIVTGDSVQVEVQKPEIREVINELAEEPEEDQVEINESIVEEEPADETVINDFEVSSESYVGIYDGESHYGNVVNIPEGAVVTYGETRENCNMLEMPEYTEAGEYTVYYKVEKDGYETYIGSFIVKIDKKIVEPPSPDIEAGVYNGKIQSPNLKNTDSYVCYGKMSAVDAGEYQVEVKLEDDRNYQWSDGNSEDKIVTWTIKPRELTIDWQAQNEFLYDGSKHTIYAELGNVAAGDFLNFTIKNHRAVNKGEYIAEVLCFEGSDNYILPKERTYKWRIIGDDNLDTENK